MTVTMECIVEGCEDRAAVRLHVPWGDTEEVCVAHARTRGQRDGVVAEPFEDADDAWP